MCGYSLLSSFLNNMYWIDEFEGKYFKSMIIDLLCSTFDFEFLLIIIVDFKFIKI